MKAINHEPMTSPEEISVLHDKKEVRKGSSQRSKFFNNREKVLGQFFTPYELTEFIVNFALKHVDNVKSAIDPACGDGAFLLTLLKKGINEVWGG
jgi:Type I restriction-modification system methyltransferase subunit